MTPPPKISRADWIERISSTVPALQVQSPEFKPQSNQKKKKAPICNRIFSIEIHPLKVFVISETMQ
jgi:hypothetical protein